MTIHIPSQYDDPSLQVSESDVTFSEPVEITVTWPEGKMEVLKATAEFKLISATRTPYSMTDLVVPAGYFMTMKAELHGAGDRGEVIRIHTQAEPTVDLVLDDKATEPTYRPLPDHLTEQQYERLNTFVDELEARAVGLPRIVLSGLVLQIVQEQLEAYTTKED